MHDPLTGLYNHSAFDILFHDADQDHIAVVIATVDGYKALRESKGKACADRVIQRVANVLRGTFRSADHVCRLQEDEFVIILTRITSAMQKQVLGKIDRINQATTITQGNHMATSCMIKYWCRKYIATNPTYIQRSSFNESGFKQKGI